MNEIKFVCKVITPMFMAGADGRVPELRPSEFKGMIRFWWRAIKAEDNIDKLRKEEAKLFGGTGKGEGKSKVGIRLLWDQTKFEKNIGNNVKKKFIMQNDGLSYLLYSTFSLKAKGEPIIRKYIKPEFSFQISFSSFNEKDLSQTLASFWLSVYLGGFGTRARRGGGNLSIEKADGNSFTIEFTPKELKTKEELKKWVGKNINKIKEMIPMGTGCRKYSNLKGASVFIFDPKNNWINALNFLGEEFRKFREQKKSDIIWRTPAFGMPVMHNRFKKRFVPYKGDERLSDRRSSPLIFKVIKAESLYFPVIVKLSGDIVYGGKVAKEQKQDNKWKFAFQKDIKDINGSILDEFLGSLKNKEEVKIE